MSHVIRDGLGWPLNRLGRAWGWLLTFGTVSLVIGLVAIFLPRETLAVIAVLFGVQLVVGGAFRIFGAFTLPDDSGWLRGALAVHALLSFGVGIYLLWHPALSLLVASLVLGAYWMISGGLELIKTIRQGVPDSTRRTLATGIIGLLAGAIVFFAPHTSLLLLSLVLGAWLVIHGLILIISGIQMRATHGAQLAG